jgi:hypothetical protein
LFLICSCLHLNFDNTQQSAPNPYLTSLFAGKKRNFGVSRNEAQMDACCSILNFPVLVKEGGISGKFFEFMS